MGKHTSYANRLTSLAEYREFIGRVMATPRVERPYFVEPLAQVVQVLLAYIALVDVSVPPLEASLWLPNELMHRVFNALVDGCNVLTVVIGETDEDKVCFGECRKDGEGNLCHYCALSAQHDKFSKLVTELDALIMKSECYTDTLMPKSLQKLKEEDKDEWESLPH